MSTFGEEVKRLRTKCGLTQKELSAKIGVSQPTIAQLEKGTIPGVSNASLFKLAAALGVDCSHFAPFFEEPPVKKKAKKK